MRLAPGQPIAYGCTSPGGGGGRGQDVVEAFVSDGEFPYSDTYTQPQVASAAVLTAAGLFQTAGFEKGGVLTNLDNFAAHVSGRVARFVSGRLPSLTQWFANAEMASGVFRYRASQSGKHAG